MALSKLIVPKFFSTVRYLLQKLDLYLQKQQLHRSWLPVPIQRYEANEGILSDELLDGLYATFVDYPTKEMFDSRNKSDEIIIEGGVIDEEYTKYAGFNAEFNTDY